MPSPVVELENIEELRAQAGIDDVELEQEIRQLTVGDHVKLTYLADSKPARSETVLVRITSVKGTTYRGKLVSDLIAESMSSLHRGSLVTFRTCHIHSIPKERRAQGD